jgi:hypothetical protein
MVAGGRKAAATLPPMALGTRVAVSVVLDCLAAGMSEAEILAEYPSLTAAGTETTQAGGPESGPPVRDPGLAVCRIADRLRSAPAARRSRPQGTNAELHLARDVLASLDVRRTLEVCWMA